MAQHEQRMSHYIFSLSHPSSCCHSSMGVPDSHTSHLWLVCSSFNMMSYHCKQLLSHCSRRHLSAGVVFLNDCPQQPNIPNFLLGLALASLLLIPFVTFSCESDAALPQQHPSASKVCLLWLITLFIITWIVAGMDDKSLRCQF